MKYLQIGNYGLLALAAAMTAVMLVVTAIMALYRERAAEIGGDLPSAVANTCAFAVLTAAAAVTCWAVRRRHALMWPAQTGLLLVLLGVLVFLRRLG